MSDKNLRLAMPSASKYFYFEFIYILFLIFSIISCSKKELDLPSVGSSVISGKLTGYNSGLSSGGLSAVSSSITAMSCNSATASIYKLNISGEKIEPALASSVLADDGSYSFKANEIGVSLVASKPQEPLMIYITGCSSGVYMRPITGAKNQNVTMGSRERKFFCVNRRFKNLNRAFLDAFAEHDSQLPEHHWPISLTTERPLQVKRCQI